MKLSFIVSLIFGVYTQQTGNWDFGTILSQLVIAHPSSQRMLFAGSETGVLKYFPFPFAAKGQVFDHYVHRYLVSSIVGQFTSRVWVGQVDFYFYY